MEFLDVLDVFSNPKDGFDTDMNFKSLMAFMDIERDDMQTIFKVLDSDGSGEVGCFKLVGVSCFRTIFLAAVDIQRSEKYRKIDCLTSKILNQQ